jgi:hypothetical protein
VDDIPLGADFRRVLQREVGGCDVQLVIIGPQWLTLTNERGQRRISDPDDFVHIEIAAGLAREDVLVIPVLVSGAGMPGSADLPPDLVELAYRNAAIIRDDPDFSRDTGRLVDQIRASIAPEERQARAAPQVTSTPSVTTPRTPSRSGSSPATRQPQPAPAPRATRHLGRWLLALVAVAALVGGGAWLAANTYVLEDLVAALGGGSGEPSGQSPEDFSEDQLLYCGSRVNGTLTAEHWKDEWLIEADEGQPVLISMSQFRGLGDLDSMVILRSASGAELAADDDSGFDANARLLYLFPETGRYIITATRAGIEDGGTTGGYSLFVECDVQPIACGHTVEGYVSLNSPLSRWAFIAEEATDIRATLEVDATQGAPPNLYVELMSPGDTPIASSERVDDYTYALYGHADDTGLYMLNIHMEGAMQQQQVQQAMEGNYILELACE